MANKFWDPVNGNDSNDGSSFANRKKTLASFTLSAGDVVRLIGSLDPTVVASADWTKGSRDVTLASAVTTTISTCETAWTASANVTATASSTRKQGSFSASLAIASGFTTGIVAYFDTGTLNLSSRQQVTFWMRSNAAVSANVFRLRLSTTTGGATATHEFVINRALNANTWTAFTFDSGGALNSAIESVALVADSDPGTVTILLDNIEAANAPSSADALTLQDLIGKNTGTGDGNDGWYPIKSIVGTTVTIDAHTNSGAGTGRGFAGSTATANMYRRSQLITDSVASSSTVVNQISTSGTSGSPITISTGWNRTDMSTQTLEGSFLTGLDGFGIGLKINAANFIILDPAATLGLDRYSQSYQIGGGATDNIIDNLHMSGSTNYHLNTTGGAAVRTQMGLNNPVICTTGGYGIFDWTSSQGLFGDCYFYSIDNESVFAVARAGYWKNVVILNCGAAYAFDIPSDNGTIINNFTCKDGVRAIGGGSSNVEIYNLTTSGNSTAVANMANFINSSIRVHNATISESTVTVGLTAGSKSRFIAGNFNGVATDQRTYADTFNIVSDTVTKESPAAFSHKFSPTNSSFCTANNPASFSRPWAIKVNANEELTFTCRMRRDSTSITARLKIFGGRHPGIANDIVADASGPINTWETVTIQCTPTSDCYIEIWPQAFGGTTLNAWFGIVTAEAS